MQNQHFPSKNKSTFNPPSFIFFNQVITKKDLEDVLSWMFRNYGVRKTSILAELLKEAGFNYATLGGLSIGIEDLKVPSSKTILVSSTNKDLEKGNTKYQRGELTSSEWFQKQVTAWNITSEVLKNEIVDFFEQTDPLNTLYMMTFSGARGNLSQVRQLIGMRGLMSDQKGEMIGSAIQKNFREGLSIIDFLISSYGARKGLVDTAIRTADSGYMTRRLIDIAQDVVIRQFDCQSKYGVLIVRSKPYFKDKINNKFEERLLGRILSKPVLNPKTKDLLAHRGEEINFELAKKIKDFNVPMVSVRSPLTCQAYRSVCQTCFGWDLTQHRLIEIGEAIGIIAAQSIGEPGTQLTMRTFHTGGVFSRELSQQIRSQYSGQVKFAETLKTNFIRTNLGDYAQLIINTSFFDITTYKNEVLRIKVERDDILLIKDGEFIKKGQPIVQSVSQIEETDTEVQKTLTTKFSGEIYYQPRRNYNFFEYNMIIWVLAGNLIILPFKSKKFIRSLPEQGKVFGKSKFVIKSNPFTESIQILKNNKIGLISEFSELRNIDIFSRKSSHYSNWRKNYILKFQDNSSLLLRKDFCSNFTSSSKLFIGRFLTNSYKVKTDGILYNLNFHKSIFTQYKIKTNQRLEFIRGGCFIWVPEQSFTCFDNKFIFNFCEGQIIKRGEWIFSNKKSPITGLIQNRKQYRKFNQLVVQGGTIFRFRKTEFNYFKIFQYLNGKFFFPGEIIFGKVLIKKVVYCQVIITNKAIQIILRPVILYNIPQPKLYVPKGQRSALFNQELLLKVKKILNIKVGEYVKASTQTPKNLVETALFINYPETLSKQNLIISANFKQIEKNKWLLEFGRSYKLNPPILKPRRLKFQQVENILTVRVGQVLEPYSIIGTSQIISKVNGSLIEAKSKYSKRYQSQELLIVDTDQIRKLYLDESKPYQDKREFLFAGDNVNENLVLTLGGKILTQKGGKLYFRIGKPYLFTEGAKVYKNHEDFAPENTVLGFVSYRIFKTQDIIQGLPKVEEILEARGSTDRAIIADKAGVVTKIVSHLGSRNNQIELLSNIKQARTIREVPYVIEEIEKENLELECYQYVNLTDRFHKGIIDPQQLLDIYFDYFKQRDSHQKASLRSLYRLASLFIKSIQGVYENQGIRILDRHLEVIVRQMIVKAKIEYSGSTPLVSGEYVDIQQLVIVNQMLKKKRKSLVYYKPAILGLTKAALATESFISAASFQESIRILTQAAIEGKVDWLRGLKEKVIIGGLIPSGTGVLTFLDEWIAKNIFLYGRSVIATKTRRKLLRRKIETESAMSSIFEDSNSVLTIAPNDNSVKVENYIKK